MSRHSGETARMQRRRAQIREVAKGLFLQFGFRGVTMDAIRSASGIRSKETIYRYYRSKEELFIDVIRSFTTEGPHLAGVMKGGPRPSSREEVRKLLAGAVGEVLRTMVQPDYLALMRVTIGELPSFPQLGALFRENVPLRAMRFMEELVRHAQEVGVIEAGKKPEAVARLLLGASLTYAIFDGLLLTRRPQVSPELPALASIAEDIVDGVVVRNQR